MIAFQKRIAPALRELGIFHEPQSVLRRSRYQRLIADQNSI
jgi:hypothetical protein